MSRNITMAEWDMLLLALAPMVAGPTVVAEADRHRISVRTTGVEVRGSVSLEINAHRELIPECRVDGAPALGGDLLYVQAGLIAYHQVVDALIWLASAIGQVIVWSDGECPCNYCSATGRTRSGVCKHCVGGKR